jgi:hypothetical protein
MFEDFVHELVPTEYREFTKEDYEAAVTLWRVAEGVLLRDADSRAGIARYLARNPDLSLVAMEGMRLVGTVLCGHDGRRGCPQHLAVSPDDRRRGIVRALVARALAAIIALALPGASLSAQGGLHEVHIELLTGAAWNLPTPLIVRLPGQAPVRVGAHYSTRPWSGALYYGYRAGGGELGSHGAPEGYEAELLHHKLYLDNPVTPIEHFEISHGYNLVTADVVRPANALAVRFGVGVVVAHAEGRIAGEKVGGSRQTLLGGGYHLAGVTAQLAVARRYTIAQGRSSLYAVPEAKLTASVARVPVGDAGGSAFVPNVAAHALAGLGLRRSWP